MATVIDTNVLLVANEQHQDVLPECIIECVRRLISIQAHGVVVIDDAYRILGEYHNKTQLSPPKGAGDVFLKWLLRNAGDTSKVHQVTINETAPDEFAEFPDPALSARFDAPDRKFVAVANVHGDRPPVWQAADCKWLHWWQELHAHGVVVEFLCPDDACRFFEKKFPKQAVPPLPDAN
jgi:hypothetical protein